METVNIEREVDEVNLEKQPETELYPFIEAALTEVESVKLELEAARAENQLLQLGNSEVEVETLNQELASLREQLEIEGASREKIEAELSPAKEKFCFGRHTFREISTRCGNHSQPARPPNVKNPRCPLQTSRQFWRL